MKQWYTLYVFLYPYQMVSQPSNCYDNISYTWKMAHWTKAKFRVLIWEGLLEVFGI